MRCPLPYEKRGLAVRHTLTDRELAALLAYWRALEHAGDNRQIRAIAAAEARSCLAHQVAREALRSIFPGCRPERAARTARSRVRWFGYVGSGRFSTAGDVFANVGDRAQEAWP